MNCGWSVKTKTGIQLMWGGNSKDGEIIIFIKNNKKIIEWCYYVDTAFIPIWKRKLHYNPGKVLNEIKKNCIFEKRIN